MQQIKTYSPPPNPAKIKDPRAGWYIKNFGETSWEVDALTPQVLYTTIEDNLKKLIDMEKFESQLVIEKTEREKLLLLPDMIKGLSDQRNRMELEIEELQNSENLTEFDNIKLNVLLNYRADMYNIKGYESL